MQIEIKSQKALDLLEEQEKIDEMFKSKIPELSENEEVSLLHLIKLFRVDSTFRHIAIANLLAVSGCRVDLESGDEKLKAYVTSLAKITEILDL